MIPVMMNNELFGNYMTKSFSDIWSTADKFYEDCSNSGIPLKLNEENTKTLFYLLYSRYGNDHIASTDENRFKYSVYRIIFSEGGTWQKQVNIQESLRALTEEEIMKGSIQIYNNAQNPGTKPTTNILDGINAQNVTYNNRDKMSAYAQLNAVLQNDVTSRFLDRFKPLFNKFAQPQCPLWYNTPITTIDSL